MGGYIFGFFGEGGQKKGMIFYIESQEDRSHKRAKQNCKYGKRATGKTTIGVLLPMPYFGTCTLYTFRKQIIFNYRN